MTTETTSGRSADGAVVTGKSVQFNRQTERSVPPPLTPEQQAQELLRKWWKRLLAVVLLLGAIVYIRHVYRTTTLARREDAAESFAKVRQDFEDLEEYQRSLAILREGKSADEKKLQESEKRVKDTRDRLQQALIALGDAPSPYAEISRLYSGLTAAVMGESERAAETLGGLEWKSKNLNSKTLINELSALALAKSFLSKPDTMPKGVALLQELASEGKVVNVSAAIALAKSAKSPEEKNNALNVLRAVKEREPEQNPVLDPEIKRLSGEGAGGQSGAAATVG